MYDPADGAQAQRARGAMARVFALAVSLGGTLSGEHGIGLAKRDFMPQAVTPATLAVMRQLKAVFDPDGILNPGKVLARPETRQKLLELGRGDQGRVHARIVR